MNYVTLIMIGLTVLPILFGLLLGMHRGSRRALLRLILIVISIALTFVLNGVVTKFVMNIKFKFLDGSVMDMIERNVAAILPEATTQFVTTLAQSLLQAVVFLLLFFVLWLLTWAILYPICKLFVKPKTIKDKNGVVVETKKHAALGMGIGAVQGVIVALCVGIVLTGLLTQISDVATVAKDVATVFTESPAPEAYSDEGYVIDEGDSDVEHDPDEGHPNGGGNAFLNSIVKYTDMITEYVNSPFGKVYNAVGEAPFDWITTIKLDNGDKITLSSQLDIVRDIGKVAKSVGKFKDIDFSKFTEIKDKQGLQDIFDTLDDVVGNLPDETKAMIDELVDSVAGELGLDFGDIKFTDIDFGKEGEVLLNMLDYVDKIANDEITEDDIDGIIENLAQSDLIINVLRQQDLDLDLDSTQLSVVESKLDELAANETVSADKIAALREIFGLN